MDRLLFACVEKESIVVRKLILPSVFFGGKTGPSCAVDVIGCVSMCSWLQGEVALVDVSGQRYQTGLPVASKGCSCRFIIFGLALAFVLHFQ